MLLGQRLGLNPAILAGVINSSTGACWSSSVNNPVAGALPDKSPPCEREYEGEFSKMLSNYQTLLMSLVQGGFATALMIKASESSSTPSWKIIPVWLTGEYSTGYGVGHEWVECFRKPAAIGGSRHKDICRRRGEIPGAYSEGLLVCVYLSRESGGRGARSTLWKVGRARDGTIRVTIIVKASCGGRWGKLYVYIVSLRGAFARTYEVLERWMHHLSGYVK